MEFLTDAIKQVPGLAVLGFVVWIFLKHLKERDDAFSEVFRQINETNLEARIESHETIQRCTVVLEKNIETRAELVSALHEVKAELRNK